MSSPTSYQEIQNLETKQKIYSPKLSSSYISPTKLTNFSANNISPSAQKPHSPYSAYSPYVINTSASKFYPLSTSQKLVNFKMHKDIKKLSEKFYSPSTALSTKSEKLSDRFIPMNKGINLLEKFKLAKKGEILDSEENNEEEMYNKFLKESVFRNEGVNSDLFIPSTSNLNEKMSKQIKSNIFTYKSSNKPKKNLFQSIKETQKENTNNANFGLENSRKINTKPYKILPANNLLDDFYLNLLDWSSKNQIAVGCGTSVVLWSVNKTQNETLLNYYNENIMNNMDLNNGNNNDKYVSSLIWAQNGEQLVVGNSQGVVELWDVNTKKRISSFSGHSLRVGVVSIFDNVLSSGSKDWLILSRDIRVKDSPNNIIVEHRKHTQEVCGLKWSFDGTQLASGGNDNNLILWSLHSPKPLMVSQNHTAAVKAIAWSPHQHNLLASGGGTADRTIRFWNTSNLQQTNKIDTGSQVCNLIFSKTSNELVSTHGFSLNQINLWKLPNMKKMATLIGHTFRVLFLGLSPNGQNIVTGAGDQTLRFWNLFPPYQTDVTSCLFPSNQDLR